MALCDELNMNKAIKLGAHEALLNIYYTASKVKKRADEFFRPFGLTDVQFNLMMLLSHQSEKGGGLSQARLSEMMLVNRANITSLVDRAERAGLVKRTPAADRRVNIVKLTEAGKNKLAKIEPAYAKEVKKIMSVLSGPEQKQLINMLEKVRNKLDENQAK